MGEISMHGAPYILCVSLVAPGLFMPADLKFNEKLLFRYNNFYIYLLRYIYGCYIRVEMDKGFFFQGRGFERGFS